MTRLKLFMIFVVVAFLVIGFGFHQNFSKTRKITINFSNSNGISVYDNSETKGDGNPKLVAEISETGQTVRLKKDHAYTVSYSGNSGYENGQLKLGPGDKEQTLDISPYYSQQKLQPLLATETAAINKVFNDTYPDVTYRLQSGKLYHRGDWYGATLSYSGNDTFNNDTLRIVFHKEKIGWVVASRPPDITLSKFLYPNIPIDVLRGVNSSP